LIIVWTIASQLPWYKRKMAGVKLAFLKKIGLNTK
jgi:hypothetical protein